MKRSERKADGSKIYEILEVEKSSLQMAFFHFDKPPVLIANLWGHSASTSGTVTNAEIYVGEYAEGLPPPTYGAKTITMHLRKSDAAFLVGILNKGSHVVYCGYNGAEREAFLAEYPSKIVFGEDFSVEDLRNLFTGQPKGKGASHPAK